MASARENWKHTHHAIIVIDNDYYYNSPQMHMFAWHTSLALSIADSLKWMTNDGAIYLILF